MGSVYLLVFSVRHAVLPKGQVCKEGLALQDEALVSQAEWCRRFAQINAVALRKVMCLAVPILLMCLLDSLSVYCVCHACSREQSALSECHLALLAQRPHCRQAILNFQVLPQCPYDASRLCRLSRSMTRSASASLGRSTCRCVLCIILFHLHMPFLQSWCLYFSLKACSAHNLALLMLMDIVRQPWLSKLPECPYWPMIAKFA